MLDHASLKLKRACKPTIRRYYESRHSESVPPSLRPSVIWVLGDDPTSDEKHARQRIEGRRDEIRTGDYEAEIYYSPNPDETDTENLELGETMTFSAPRIAETGVDPEWGIFLRRVVEHTNSSRILELGSCAGISGAYMGSAPTCEEIVTIEASADLAEIAKETLTGIDINATVHNMTFEGWFDQSDATDERPFDFVYIDGHHERTATLEYYRRSKPYLRSGSIVVFDDIYWSEDMNRAWDDIRRLDDFGTMIDTPQFGVCEYAPDTQSTLHDVSKFVGRPPIRSQHGVTESLAKNGVRLRFTGGRTSHSGFCDFTTHCNTTRTNKLTDNGFRIEWGMLLIGINGG